MFLLLGVSLPHRIEAPNRSYDAEVSGSSDDHHAFDVGHDDFSENL